MTASALAAFARHELRLAWRDAAGLLIGGRRRRRVGTLVAFALFAAFLHLLAYGLLAEPVRHGIGPDKRTLAVLTASLALSWCLLLSQGIESVTRAFYARGDLDLILSSPAPVTALFAVRIAGIALSGAGMAVVIASPALDVLALLGGPGWLAGYPVAAALGAAAGAVAVVVTAGLFRLIGAARTRVVAQVAAAVIGAAFAIAVQGAAILSYGDADRWSFLASDAVLDRLPATGSLLYGPARAILGDGSALAALVLGAFLLLGLAIAIVAPRFAAHSIAAAGVPRAERVRRSGALRFRPRSPARVLREKEWTLLVRDPWLVSQTLMQILYLLPAALLLWRSFGEGTNATAVLVPVLVMAAGQLSGGLAWLAVSGEDAPDLVGTAPVTPRQLVRAKIEAVLGAVLLATAPLLLALFAAAPETALVAAGGIALAAASATAIQLWFRSQARRAQFRRRQTSSRIATFAEAFSSILWAATAALAAQGVWVVALATGLVCAAMLGAVRAISPRTA